jgi:hypothetical protein
MTSTNIFTGIEGNRSSSRVLRPPGGGHTNILAYSTEYEPPKEDLTNTASQIMESVNRELDSREMKTVEKTSNDGSEKSRGIASETEVKSAPEPATVNRVHRVRIPPGGFSSGLW